MRQATYLTRSSSDVTVHWISSGLWSEVLRPQQHFPEEAPIDHRQNTERTCIEQLIVHEIHTQPLVWVCRLRNHAAMETPVLTSLHPELQALETIQPMHALTIDPPSLTPQHHVDPQDSRTAAANGQSHGSAAGVPA